MLESLHIIDWRFGSSEMAHEVQETFLLQADYHALRNLKSDRGQMCGESARFGRTGGLEAWLKGPNRP